MRERATLRVRTCEATLQNWASAYSSALSWSWLCSSPPPYNTISIYSACTVYYTQSSQTRANAREKRSRLYYMRRRKGAEKGGEERTPTKGSLSRERARETTRFLFLSLPLLPHSQVHRWHPYGVQQCQIHRACMHQVFPSAGASSLEIYRKRE